MSPKKQFSPGDRLEKRLLILAGLFFIIGSAALSISPAVRARSWDAALRWEHWAGVGVWIVVFSWLHHWSVQKIPLRDPYLLPISGLLSAWGLLTIYRLEPGFGLRQSAWLLVAGAMVTAGAVLPANLGFLRKYKYLWLTVSLFLAGLTLFFGVNPMGYGAEMWLGCCGMYLQPTEPLKLIFIAYLAAYLADRYSYLAFSGKMVFNDIMGLLAPSLIMTGLALALLVAQRDLGTATIFILLYAAIVFTASGRKRVLLISAILVALAGVVGYLQFDVVRLRVEAWINPWLDPSGRSYQIVQSLIAIANGGLVGRGPGLGNPGLVPLTHSDLIFSAIAEEYGLVGVVALLLLLGLLAHRGLVISMNAPDTYRRYLSAGLTAYLVGQALLIIAGSLRLLPLTGITLPFVSYGGSSLLTSFAALLLLMLISGAESDLANQGARPASLPGFGSPQLNVYPIMGIFLFVALAAAALASGWWTAVRGQSLLTRTDNPRRAIEDRWVQRGAILDRNLQPINISSGEPGDFVRKTMAPDLSNVVGYTDPTYGQAGLEASLDSVLRGESGVSSLDSWWSHLVYGQPAPGLDVRLSLDLELQGVADELLLNQQGAAVLMDAVNGEILVMSSHPTFDANQLADEWQNLVSDPSSPLLNRAFQGTYPLGGLETALFPQGFMNLDLNEMPHLVSKSEKIVGLPGGYSPLQVVLAAAVISNEGLRPGPKLVTGINTPEVGWIVREALDPPQRILPAAEVEALAQRMATPLGDRWEITQVVKADDNRTITWYLGGTMPEFEGRSFALVVVLETGDLEQAQQIGLEILRAAGLPE